MFSFGESEFIEVGNVSVYGDFLSKRMMLKAVEKEGEVLRDLRTVGGTLIDVTKAIGCLVEARQSQDGSYEL